jgi:hypothetical protein
VGDLDAPTTVFLLAPAVLLVLLRTRFARRGARFGAALFILLLLLHPALTPWMRPQYLAPAAAGFFLCIALALRAMTRWRFGRALVAGILASQLAAAAAVTIHYATRDRPPGIRRQEIVQQLEAQPGRQLVLVRYTECAAAHLRMGFYNDADIDGQRVIFARSLDPASDAQLTRPLSGPPGLAAHRRWRPDRGAGRGSPVNRYPQVTVSSPDQPQPIAPDRKLRAWVAIIVCVVLAVVSYAMSAFAVLTKSPTADEPYHFAAAYTHVFEHDFRVDPEDPPLWSWLAMLPIGRDRETQAALHAAMNSPDAMALWAQITRDPTCSGRGWTR